MKIGRIALITIMVLTIGFMIGGIIGGDYTTANVAIIPISGPIFIDTVDDFFGSTGASSTDIARWIETADAEPSIEVILLEINSPGGSAVASDEIVQALARTEKPVVAWIREAGASGAYWAASQADHIIANRMSITGSVGVIASYIEFAEFFDEYNLTYRQLQSGDLKDLGNPFTELTEEREAIIQDKLELIHDMFVEDVAERRNLTNTQTRQIRNGAYLLGIEAQELGLVDALGGRYEVQEYLEELLGEEPMYQRYERQKSFVETLVGARSFTLPTTLRIQA